MKKYSFRDTTAGAIVDKPRIKPTKRQKKIDKARLDFLKSHQEDSPTSLGGIETFFDTVEAAEYLHLKPQTLVIWRCTKRYPIPYIKIGRNVRYRKSDLDEWIKSRTVNDQ